MSDAVRESGGHPWHGETRHGIADQNDIRESRLLDVGDDGINPILNLQVVDVGGVFSSTR